MRDGNTVSLFSFCLRRGALLAPLCVALLAATAWAQPANDLCSNPTPISGSGTFPFNLAGSTPDPAGNPFHCGAAAPVDLLGDVWYCWTADCTGVVTISTCGQIPQGMDTVVAVYDGCACPPVPAQPRCCNDDGPPNCRPASLLQCDVTCGQQYMIQIGYKPGGATGAGTFTIDCAGQPCGGGHTDCCVDFNDNNLHGWSNGGTNVAIDLRTPGPSGNSTDYYLHGRDLAGPSAIFAPPACNGDWSTFNTGGCGAFCFDIRIFIDGNNMGSLSITPSFVIQNAAGVRAQFVASTAITEDGGYNPGWHHVCAPVALLDSAGNLPSNSYGSWQMLDGQPNSAWNSVITAVDIVRFPIDFTSNPAEEVGYDNFCLKDNECPPTDADCCGRKPQYTDHAYITFNGQVAAMTANVHDNPPMYALTIFDIKDAPTAPQGVNWNPAGFRYNDPRWTTQNLGSLFGLTFDDRGNIFAAHGTCYYADQVGTLAGSTTGTIYKIADATGTPTVFANLPNTGAGIGDVTYDCDHTQLFASNFDDGRIYRIDGNTGATLGTYNHATDTVQLGYTPYTPPGHNPGDFAPFNARVWAVKKLGDRLYYSIWSRDERNWDTIDNNPPNTIWSIGLTPTGNFVPGSRVLELNMPSYPGQGGHRYSNPVADITFSNGPVMLLAERSMFADSSPDAHKSRLLEYQRSGTSWVLTTNNTNANGPNFGFPIGVLSEGTNSAGGCAYDDTPNGRAYNSGDALHFSFGDYIYGATGVFRDATGTTANSLFFDYNGVVTDDDKFEIGDIEIPCPPPLCMQITDSTVHCEIGADGLPTGNYTITASFINNSGMTIQYILFPDVNITPNVITLNPVIPNGGAGTFTFTLHNATPLTSVCIDILLADRRAQLCCHINACFDIPECNCAEIGQISTNCVPGAGGDFTLTFSFTNLTTQTIEHLFLLPPSPGVTFTPDYIHLSPTIPPGGTSAPITVTVSGAQPGSELCFLLSLHDTHLMECCGKEICVRVPDCTVHMVYLRGDANCDGVVNNFDIDAFVLALTNPAAYAQQYPGCYMGNSDINEDGAVNNFDITPFVECITYGCN